MKDICSIMRLFVTCIMCDSGVASCYSGSETELGIGCYTTPKYSVHSLKWFTRHVIVTFSRSTRSLLFFMVMSDLCFTLFSNALYWPFILGWTIPPTKDLICLLDLSTDLFLTYGSWLLIVLERAIIFSLLIG